MVALLTQPNTRPGVKTFESHTLPFSGLCPHSGNPQEGSTIRIEYCPKDHFLEVYSLRKYIDSFIGGKGEVRDMEGMVQQTALDCAKAIQAAVKVTAQIVLQGHDTMTIVCEGEV